MIIQIHQRKKIDAVQTGGPQSLLKSFVNIWGHTIVRHNQQFYTKYILIQMHFAGQCGSILAELLLINRDVVPVEMV